jgi:23S rRNA pseudouridine2605 synthase
MATAGLGSRRALETQIREGAIQINGKTASLGISVEAGDRLQWGEREWLVVADQQQHRSLIYNKPEGEITSRSDPEGRPTVFDHLPFVKGARWIAIGRLDINTTGLLILTTDGELAHAMMHPSNQVDREYVCRVRGLVTDEQVAQLKSGIMLDDGLAHFTDVQRMGGPSTASAANQWYQVTLLEGRNREVRRLWEAIEHMVSRLKRVRYGAALLPKGLKVGHWHEISARDHQVLREDVGLAEASAELTLQPVRTQQETDQSPARGRRNTGGRKGRVRKETVRSSDWSPWDDAAAKKEAAGGGTPASRNPASKAGTYKAGSKTHSKPHSKPGPRPGSKPSSRSGSKPGSKPGSPAGAGRRPHPKSRRSGK